MGQTRNPRRHCLSALSPLDVFIYAPRGEITKSTGVSLPLLQAEDFVFSLKRPPLGAVSFRRFPHYLRVRNVYKNN